VGIRGERQQLENQKMANGHGKETKAENAKQPWARACKCEVIATYKWINPVAG